MTLGERIKKVRKALDLTQQEFAGRIGTTANVLTNYETGRRNPSASAFNNICKTFNINETWLRTGEGEMFLQQTEEDQIAAAVERLITGESSEFKKRLVLALSSMKDEHWLLLEQKLKEIVGERPSEEQAEVESLAQQAAQLTRDQGLSERGPDTPASSASGSGGG